ncbi:uncharacterized protein PHALS_14357 [Plasmopara halstedii]|uniref:Uncharacterized protein n=1 Tax=Plasmopara halstedii TaxID=4781 RepID=A0A0P1ARC2_PLAHL|nr:uncharacterized protein PHALS_14357 [Plasmopara halstedii]CEG44090.1 hypothetical protein PHALS_14357 [Plasmopara halstedii]|eukprot:XP_024580459.1 hypothetical protein PHALS_14357 [Plasmopara halstedii]
MCNVGRQDKRCYSDWQFKYETLRHVCQRPVSNEQSSKTGDIRDQKERSEQFTSAQYHIRMSDAKGIHVA